MKKKLFAWIRKVKEEAKQKRLEEERIKEEKKQEKIVKAEKKVSDQKEFMFSLKCSIEGDVCFVSCVHFFPGKVYTLEFQGEDHVLYDIPRCLLWGSKPWEK